MDASSSKPAVALYRWMLRAYPRGFRDRYQADMLLDFQDAYRTARAEHGLTGLFTFWATTTLDWLGSVLTERSRRMSYGSPLLPMIDISQFNSQLVATVRLWERCLREGYNVLQMLEITAQNAPEPTAGVLRDTLAQVEASQDLPGAIAALPAQIDSPHLRRVVDVILNQRQTGGNLADRLQALQAELQAELGGERWDDDLDLSPEQP